MAEHSPKPYLILSKPIEWALCLNFILDDQLVLIMKYTIRLTSIHNKDFTPT